ncbi:hypothetical protein C0991_004178, partial [Blastosporella zonata]
MAGETLIIDDADPRIVYTGFWERAGIFAEYKSTTHGTSSSGAQATFIFNGTLRLPCEIPKSTMKVPIPGPSISVFGTIGHENNNGDPLFAPTTTYRLDGGTAVNFTHTPKRGVLYRQPFFQAQDLEEGIGKEHTLVIENTVSGKNMVWLDYLQLVSSTERPLPVVRPSPPSNPVLGGKSAEFLGGVLMGSATTIIIFLCLFMISIRRFGRPFDASRHSEDARAPTPDFSHYERNRRRNRSEINFFDEQLDMQVSLIGDDENGLSRSARRFFPDAPHCFGDVSLATTGLPGVGLRGNNFSYQRVAPVGPRDPAPDVEATAMAGGNTSFRVKDVDQNPPAYS